MFVLDILFTLLLYLSLSLLLLLEEDELVLFAFPLAVPLPVLPVVIPEMPADEEVEDWMPIATLLLPLPITAEEEEDVEVVPVELFEALEDFLCFDDDDVVDDPL